MNWKEYKVNDQLMWVLIFLIVGGCTMVETIAKCSVDKAAYENGHQPPEEYGPFNKGNQ